MANKVISTGVRFSTLPKSYIRPESERPNLSQVSECENVPIIDLGCPEKHLVIQQIGDACRDHAFFQVINHGVSTGVFKMQKVASEFYRLPVEEKMKLYSDDPSKTMRLSNSFNVQKETVHNLRDYLRLHGYPLEQYTPAWPSNPSSFKMEPVTVNESQEDDVIDRTAFPSPPPVATIPPLPPSVSLPPDNSISAPHVTRPLNPIIDQIQKDNIASKFLKNQLPSTIVAMAFTLISAKSGHYESAGILMLVLLVLALLAFITGKVVWDELPVVAAAAELIGISLSAAAFIYPMTVLLGGPILCYVPPIIGLVVAGMYVYRLATASSGNM